jgi:hypothetical protein
MPAKERSRDRISRGASPTPRPLPRSTSDEVDLVRRDGLTDNARMRPSRREGLLSAARVFALSSTSRIVVNRETQAESGFGPSGK